MRTIINYIDCRLVILFKFRYFGVFALVFVCHGAALAFAWLNVQPPKSLATSVKSEQQPTLTGLLVAPKALQSPPLPAEPKAEVRPKPVKTSRDERFRNERSRNERSRNDSQRHNHSKSKTAHTQVARSRPVIAKPLPSGPESARAVAQVPTTQVPTAAAAKTATAKPKAEHQPAQATLQLPSTAATSAQNQAPLYPKISRKRKEQGTVLLLLLVSKLGQVESIQIKRSSGFSRLDQAALQAVKQWRFTAASQNGQAIDYWYEMPINFSLNQTQ